jgi:hypothetical protein
MVERVSAAYGHDDENRGIDGINAFTEDGSLAAALTEVGFIAGAVEEGAGILEVVALGDAAERLARRQWLAVGA